MNQHNVAQEGISLGYVEGRGWVHNEQRPYHEGLVKEKQRNILLTGKVVIQEQMKVGKGRLFFFIYVQNNDQTLPLIFSLSNI